MKNLKEILQDADPLRYEPVLPRDGQDLRRQAVLAAASNRPELAGRRLRTPIAIVSSIVFLATVVSLLGPRVVSLFVGELRAAVPFEVRLAEESPAPGLLEAKVSGSNHSVYLHADIVVSNSDIAAARLNETGDPPRYSIAVEFSESGKSKMLTATETHIGKPVAIILDGKVVMAPVVRTPIGASAVITGNYSRREAERIINGITIK